MVRQDRLTPLAARCKGTPSAYACTTSTRRRGYGLVKRKKAGGAPHRPSQAAAPHREPPAAFMLPAAIPHAGAPCARQGPAQRVMNRQGSRATAGRRQTLAKKSGQPEASTGNKRGSVSGPTRSQGQGIEDQGRRMQAPGARNHPREGSNGRKARSAAHAPGKQRTRKKALAERPQRKSKAVQQIAERAVQSVTGLDRPAEGTTGAPFLGGRVFHRSPTAFRRGLPRMSGPLEYIDYQDHTTAGARIRIRRARFKTCQQV